MKISVNVQKKLATLSIITALVTMSGPICYSQEKISFGIHADPVISWFSSDIKQVRNNGARPGFSFGLTYNKYFTSNYSFSTGISLLSTGGKIVSSDTAVLDFSKVKLTVLPGTTVEYKLQYLAIPIGLKLQTNQIGYITFFSDVGFVPKVVVNRRIDIPSLSIAGENGSNELRMFNVSYHITGGIEYSLGGSTSLMFGLDFDNNFLDLTKDKGSPHNANLSQKILSFRFGVNF
jgi:hypothetical protein